jgi:hypothetical protein
MSAIKGIDCNKQSAPAPIVIPKTAARHDLLFNMWFSAELVLYGGSATQVRIRWYYQGSAKSLNLIAQK